MKCFLYIVSDFNPFTSGGYIWSYKKKKYLAKEAILFDRRVSLQMSLTIPIQIFLFFMTHV